MYAVHVWYSKQVAICLTFSYILTNVHISLQFYKYQLSVSISVSWNLAGIKKSWNNFKGVFIHLVMYVKGNLSKMNSDRYTEDMFWAELQIGAVCKWVSVCNQQHVGSGSPRDTAACAVIRKSHRTECAVLIWLENTLPSTAV